MSGYKIIAQHLSLLDKDIASHPERVQPADDLIAEMEELLGSDERLEPTTKQNPKDLKT